MSPVRDLLLLAVRTYRVAGSPLKNVLFGPAACCRFTPTCSAYAAEALLRHGALAGSWLAVRRVGRCHPWGGRGPDPVPATADLSAARGETFSQTPA